MLIFLLVTGANTACWSLGASKHSSPHAERSVVGRRAAGHSLHCLWSCMTRSMYSFLPVQGLQLTCLKPWGFEESLSN